MNNAMEKKILLETMVNSQKKSIAIAYILLFLFSGLGFHRMYLGKIFSGILMFCVTILMFTYPFLSSSFDSSVSIICMFFLIIFLLMDIFLIPLFAKKNQTKLREKLQKEIDATPTLSKFEN